MKQLQRLRATSSASLTKDSKGSSLSSAIWTRHPDAQWHTRALAPTQLVQHAHTGEFGFVAEAQAASAAADAVAAEFVPIEKLGRAFPWSGLTAHHEYAVEASRTALHASALAEPLRSRLVQTASEGGGVRHYPSGLVHSNKRLTLAWGFNLLSFGTILFFLGWVVIASDAQASLVRPPLADATGASAPSFSQARDLYRCIEDYWAAVFVAFVIGFLGDLIIMDPFFLASTIGLPAWATLRRQACYAIMDAMPPAPAVTSCISSRGAFAGRWRRWARCPACAASACPASRGSRASGGPRRRARAPAPSRATRPES